MSELNAIIGVSYIPIFQAAQLSEQPLSIQFAIVCCRLLYSFLRLPSPCQPFVRHSSGICQNCLHILVDRKAFWSCFSQFSLLASCRTQMFCCFFMRKIEKRQRKKTPLLTIGRRLLSCGWLPRCLVEQLWSPLKSHNYRRHNSLFFWLECCWPKQYCTVMHFVYFLSSLFVSLFIG